MIGMQFEPEHCFCEYYAVLNTSLVHTASNVSANAPRGWTTSVRIEPSVDTKWPARTSKTYLDWKTVTYAKAISKHVVEMNITYLSIFIDTVVGRLGINRVFYKLTYLVAVELVGIYIFSDQCDCVVLELFAPIVNFLSSLLVNIIWLLDNILLIWARKINGFLKKAQER